MKGPRITLKSWNFSESKNPWDTFLLCNRGFGGILAPWLSERYPATFRRIFASSGPDILQGTQCLLQIFTQSVTGRNLELLLNDFCHRRPTTAVFYFLNCTCVSSATEGNRLLLSLKRKKHRPE